MGRPTEGPPADRLNIVHRRGYSPWGDGRYLLLSADTWTSAEAYAQSEFGAHLATVDSDAENAEIFNRFTASGTIPRWLYIGLNDVATEGTFVWSSGDPVTYTNWRAGEPSGNGEDYVALIAPTRGNAGMWNDIPDVTSFFTYGATNIPITTHGVVEVKLPEPASLGLLLLAAIPAARRARRARRRA